MDLVRKISIFLFSLVFLCVNTSCRRVSGVEPETFLRIVRFSDDSYKNFVLAEQYSGEIIVQGWRSGPWHQDSSYRGGHYIALAKNCYIAEYFRFNPDDVLINKTWSEWSQNEIYFSESDILTTHPYSDFFKVGQYELKADIFPIDERVMSMLNAMIEDGSIEKYRVDLGY